MATISKTLLSALKAVENEDWKKVILLSNTLKKSDKVLCYSAREANTSPFSQNPSAFPLVMGLYDYNEKGDVDEAAEMFTTVLSNEATNPIALFYLSSINYEKGKYKKVLKRLSDFTIDLSFGEMGISENTINAYEMMSNIAKFDLLVLKGKCLIKSKQTKEGIELFKAIKKNVLKHFKDEENISSHFHRSYYELLLAIALNQSNESQKEMQRCIQSAREALFFPLRFSESKMYTNQNADERSRVLIFLFSTLLHSVSKKTYPKPIEIIGITIPKTRTEELHFLLEELKKEFSSKNQSKSVKEYLSRSVCDDMLMLFNDEKEQDLLVNNLEDIMGFQFDNYHSWSQFAFVLYKAKQYERCIQIVKEAIAINPKKVEMYLLGATVSLTNLNDPFECIKYCDKALSLFNKHDLDDIEKDEENDEENDETESHMEEENIEENDQEHTIKQKENCLLLKGMAALRLTLICGPDERQEHFVKALCAFLCVKRLTCSAAALFGIAVTSALLRDIKTALHAAKLAVKKGPGNGKYWNLLVLVISANKREDTNFIETALKAVQEGERRCPNYQDLYVTHIKLLNAKGDVQTALKVIQKLFTLICEKNANADSPAKTKAKSNQSSSKDSESVSSKSTKTRSPNQELQTNEDEIIDPSAWLIAADTFALNRQYDDSISCLHSAQKIISSNIKKNECEKSETFIRSKLLLADAFAKEGEVLLKQQSEGGKEDKTKKEDKKEEQNPLNYFHDAIRLVPNHSTSLIELVKLILSEHERHTAKLCEEQKAIEVLLSASERTKWKPKSENDTQPFNLSRHMLDVVLQNDPDNVKAWYYLGTVLDALSTLSDESLELKEEALQCFFTATTLEETTPITPFSEIICLKKH